LPHTTQTQYLPHSADAEAIPKENLQLTYPSIFTFFGMFLEVAALWAYRKENTPAPAVQEKDNGTRAPLDAPVGPAPGAAV
jgi:hypothetical protein